MFSTKGPPTSIVQIPTGGEVTGGFPLGGRAPAQTCCNGIKSINSLLGHSCVTTSTLLRDTELTV